MDLADPKSKQLARSGHIQKKDVGARPTRQVDIAGTRAQAEGVKNQDVLLAYRGKYLG